MSNAYLHREVREKGGAYGAGASVGTTAFSMTSYRDPQPAKARADGLRWFPVADRQGFVCRHWWRSQTRHSGPPRRPT
jgi:hypothetical protein